MNLFAHNGIAGAVAREIRRLEVDPRDKSEGAAYKAAFDRAGSPWEKHCAAHLIDCCVFDRLQPHLIDTGEVLHVHV